VSATIRDVHYDVTFMRANAQQRIIDVAMSFNTAGAAPVILSLPAWTPGAYEISNYARKVSNFSASAAGPLVWDKSDYDTWRVRPVAAGEVVLRFDFLADSLDNASANPTFSRSPAYRIRAWKRCASTSSAAFV